MPRSSVLGFGFVLGLGLTSTAQAYTRLDNGAGAYVALPAGEVVLELDGIPHAASFDHQALQEAVDTAIATWSELGMLPLELHRADANEAVANGVPVITVIDQDRTWDHAPVLAVTALTSAAKTGLIMSAEMDINDVAFDFATRLGESDDPKKPRYDLVTVITHELGHALGLGHSTDKTAIMYPDIPPGPLGAPLLSEDDRAGIAAVYAGVTLPAKSSSSTKPDTGTVHSTMQTTTPTTASPGCSAAPGAPASSSALFGLLLCVGAALLRQKSRTTH